MKYIKQYKYKFHVLVKKKIHVNANGNQLFTSIFSKIKLFTSILE